jgi:uncharacterized membrane protein required for colicin V production
MKMHFNFVDVIIAAYAWLGAVRGRRNGLAAELPWAISWAVALFTGSGIYRWTSRGLESAGHAAGVTFGLFGFAAVLVAAYLMVRKLRRRIGRLAEMKVSGDQSRRRWGAVAGGLRAFLFCSCLILFFSLLPLGILKKPFTEGSFIGRIVIGLHTTAPREGTRSTPSGRHGDHTAVESRSQSINSPPFTSITSPVM